MLIYVKKKKKMLLGFLSFAVHVFTQTCPWRGQDKLLCSPQQ